MVGAAALGAHTAAGQAVDDDIVGRINIERHIDMGNLIQRFRLSDGAREAIQNIAMLAIRLGQTFLDHGNDHLIGNQLALVNIALGVQTRGGLLADCTAEHIAGGNLRDAQLLHQSLRMRALAGAGGAQENNIHIAGSFLSKQKTGERPRAGHPKAARA